MRDWCFPLVPFYTRIRSILRNLRGDRRPPAPSGLVVITGILGLAMIFGIPAGIVGEIVRWRRSKRAQKGAAPSLQQTVSSPVKYCTQCGKQVQTGLRSADSAVQSYDTGDRAPTHLPGMLKMCEEIEYVI